MSVPCKVAKGLKCPRTEGSGSWVPGEEVDLSTGLVHCGVMPDPVTGAILTPLYQSTTFVQDSIAEYQAKGYSYTRCHNPTVRALEEKIAALENGHSACAFSTGMAAMTTIVSSFMSTGDHAIVTNCSYGGTNRACRVVFTRLGMTFTFVDMTDVTNVAKAIRDDGCTKLVISESPCNPTLTLTDLRALSDICQAHKLIHVCDSTFATPVICRPMEYGVDMVLQSTTKYYDGHNMTVGGCVISRTAELDQNIRFHLGVFGNSMSPDVAFLQLQTTKTLELRMLRQSATAMTISTFLESHPKVERVRYPGLASFPQKALADKQHRNGIHGGMLWFEVNGGKEAGRRLMDTVTRPWSLCENLGATESIITCPSVMTHANMLVEDRLRVGITDGFVRVSCGLEDAEDLIRALRRALDAL